MRGDDGHTASCSRRSISHIVINAEQDQDTAALTWIKARGVSVE
jgi:hypothetical protein